MAKKRARTDWQLDLKPVALSPQFDRGASANGNGEHPQRATPPTAAAVANPALTRALGELRASDEALMGGLGEIRVVLQGMRASIDELAGRLGAVEARIAAATRPAAARPVRETSRTLRDSATGPIEGRTRRAAAKPDETPEQ